MNFAHGASVAALAMGALAFSLVEVAGKAAGKAGQARKAATMAIYVGTFLLLFASLHRVPGVADADLCPWWSAFSAGVNVFTLIFLADATEIGRSGLNYPRSAAASQFFAGQNVSVVKEGSANTILLQRSNDAASVTAPKSLRSRRASPKSSWLMSKEMAVMREVAPASADGDATLRTALSMDVTGGDHPTEKTVDISVTSAEAVATVDMEHAADSGLRSSSWTRSRLPADREPRALQFPHPQNASQRELPIVLEESICDCSDDGDNQPRIQSLSKSPKYSVILPNETGGKQLAVDGEDVSFDQATHCKTVHRVLRLDDSDAQLEEALKCHHFPTGFPLDDDDLDVTANSFSSVKTIRRNQAGRRWSLLTDQCCGHAFGLRKGGSLVWSSVYPGQRQGEPFDHIFFLSEAALAKQPWALADYDDCARLNHEVSKPPSQSKEVVCQSPTRSSHKGGNVLISKRRTTCENATHRPRATHPCQAWNALLVGLVCFSLYNLICSGAQLLMA